MAFRLRFSRSLIFPIFFVLTLLGAASAQNVAHADNAGGPFISETVRNNTIDYQQLIGTISCLPTNTDSKAEFIDNSVPADDAIIANITELNKQKVLDQGLFGVGFTRGSMFKYEVSECDGTDDFGFRWPFVTFGRADLVDFFCSLPGVYNSKTGGLGRTVNGGSTKKTCMAGTTIKGSLFVTKKGTNLAAAVKAEFTKTNARAKAAVKAVTNGLTPAEKYVQYWLTFQKACGAKLTTVYPTDSDPAANDGATYKVPIVNQNGDLVFYTAIASKDTSKTKIVLDATHPFPGDMTCADLMQPWQDTFAPKYAAYMKGPGKNDTGVAGTGIVELSESDLAAQTDTTQTQTTCAVDGVGWIVCPAMNFMAKLNDTAFKYLKDILTVRPALISDPSTKNAWGTFRDLANVAFVIAFLVIVYSQLTSVGVSNYGVKKLLPKIIIAAIFVNVSYFVCALLVDLSNIFGSGLYGLLSNLVHAPSGGAVGTGTNNWVTVVGGILASVAAAVLLIIIVITCPLVLLALAVVLLILIARQAFVLLLLIISPLAFVAYLLPNTESLFKKWWKSFTAILMVYPIVGAIFGASTLAANILMGVAQGESGNDATLLKIVALSVLAIPMFAIPGILKGSMAAAGTLGARLQNLADRTSNRASSQVKDRGSQKLADTGNRFANSMYRRGGIAASLTSGLSGAGRRERYKQNAALKESAEEDHFNRDGSKTATKRQQVAEAQSTTGVRSKIVQDRGKLDSLNNNHELHTQAINTGLDLSNAEQTHKNTAETQHNLVNPDQYDALNQSKDRLQIAQTTNTSRYADSATGRQLAQDQKVVEGRLDIVKSEHDRDYKQSQVGQAQGQAKRVVEGDVKNADKQMDVTYEQSTEGNARAQTGKRLEGELEVAKGEQDIQFERSVEGQNLAVVKDDVQQRKVTAQAANEELAINRNEAVRVTSAAATARVDAAKASEKALIDVLATDEGAAANPQYSAAAGVLKTADASKRVSTNQSTVASKNAERAFIESADGRRSELGTQVAEENLAAAKSEEEAIVQELKAGGVDDKGNLITVPGLSNAEVQSFATDLNAADTTKRVQTQRASSAANIANVNYAKAVGDDTTGLAKTAGGIDSAGESRAKAAAIQVQDKQLTEAIATQKTTMESQDPDTLFGTMMNEGLSTEERAAAGGLLMSRGGDQHVQEVLDYLGTVTPTDADGKETIKMLQKQVAADIGARKPQGLGKTDISKLAQGSYGANGVEFDPATGTITKPGTPIGFEESLVSRLNKGKFGAEELAKMSGDELFRLAHAVGKKGVGTGPGQVEPDVYDALKDSIAKVTTDPNLKAAVDSPEQQVLLANLLKGGGTTGSKIFIKNPDFGRKP